MHTAFTSTADITLHPVHRSSMISDPVEVWKGTREKRSQPSDAGEHTSHSCSSSRAENGQRATAHSLSTPTSALHFWLSNPDQNPLLQKTHNNSFTFCTYMMHIEPCSNWTDQYDGKRHFTRGVMIKDRHDSKVLQREEDCLPASEDSRLTRESSTMEVPP